MLETVQDEVTSRHNGLLFQLLSAVSPDGLTPEQVRETVRVEVSSGVPAGRGLVFTEDVRPGQLLLSLPSKSLFNAGTLEPFLPRGLIPSKPSVAGKVPTSGEPTYLSSPQALSLILARWRASHRLPARLHREDLTSATASETLDRFAATMPGTFDTVPLWWSVYAKSAGGPESLGHQIGDSPDVQGWKKRFYTSLLQALPYHSQKLLEEVSTRFERDWKRVEQVGNPHPELRAVPAVVSSAANGAAGGTKGGRLTLAHFLWAWLCVNSRCVFFPLGLPLHADNFTLAPLLDMANHTSQASLECKVQFNPSGGLELYAPPSSARPLRLGRDGMRKGDECFITYGAHSNAFLLSEYGFVLPRVCPVDDEEDGCSERDRTWTGNRFCEVNVDREVELLFREQGAEGDRKRELLQDRGYWSDYTLHPSPGPAHPSHRLVPALRLLALRLPQGSSEPRHIDKSRKLTHRQESRATPMKPTSKSAVHVLNEARRQVPLRKGKPALERDGWDLERWEATLSGHEETVSEANEVEAHRWLVRLCERLLEVYKSHLRALSVAQAILGESTAKDENGCGASFEFVQQLVDEELQIVELVRGAAERQDEW